MFGLTSRRRSHELTTATSGHGPLLRRDYWARLADCRIACSQVGEMLSARLPEFAPPDLARFRRADGRRVPLEVGDELEVWIRFAGSFGVRVIDRNANSLTLGTLAGHPEAGRITFGAYRHESGDAIFHIRSLARASSRLRLTEFRAFGVAMQTNTWTWFVERVAADIGSGVVGVVHEETREHRGPTTATGPTYLAQGD